MAVVDQWRNYPQPSYNLDTHNCVTFVKEIALQLPASDDEKFIRSPRGAGRFAITYAREQPRYRDGNA
jgi:hypothetical protein